MKCNIDVNHRSGWKETIECLMIKIVTNEEYKEKIEYREKDKYY